VAEREAWVLVLYQGGASVYEIAALLGAGREWVRQCVLAAGLPWRRGVRQVDALAILREVRRPDTLSLKAVAARLGYSEETVRQSVMALGMSEAVRRLLRLRRRSARRVAAAGVVDGLAALTLRAIGARRTQTARVA
jgi:transposase